MNKRIWHHYWTRIRPISYWYFIVACIVSGLTAVYGLRQNNLTAIKLRDEVILADKNNGDVEAALRRLRGHVHAHMNTNLASSASSIRPPIQLKYRYERLVQAEKERVSAVNTKVNSDAQAYCERQFPNGLTSSGRLPCVQDYISRNGIKEQAIPDDLYKFDFASPRWSPDLAGWSLVAVVLFGILALTRFILERWLKSRLAEHG